MQCVGGLFDGGLSGAEIAPCQPCDCSGHLLLFRSSRRLRLFVGNLLRRAFLGVGPVGIARVRDPHFVVLASLADAGTASFSSDEMKKPVFGALATERDFAFGSSEYTGIAEAVCLQQPWCCWLSCSRQHQRREIAGARLERSHVTTTFVPVGTRG